MIENPPILCTIQSDEQYPCGQTKIEGRKTIDDQEQQQEEKSDNLERRGEGKSKKGEK